MLPQSRPHAAAKKAGMYAFFLPKEKGDTDSSTGTSEQAPSTYEYVIRHKDDGKCREEKAADDVVKR